MPRLHPKYRKAQGKKAAGGAKTVEELIQAAEEATDNLQVEKAIVLYRRALALDPKNYNLMDALAELSLQVGESDEALRLLTVSTEKAPETNPIKWMYLAQLLRGEDAVRAYRRGIELLTQSNSQELQSEIVAAYCAIAELYMTDLCFEPNAEESCETAIMNALVLNSTNTEALQTLASLRISQCRKLEAAEIIANLYRKYDEVIRLYQQRTLQDDLRCTEEDMEKLHNLPTPEHCVALVKLLLECVPENEQTKQHFPTYAEFLLQFVLQFDDENPEVWYLLGMSNKDVDVDAAVEAFVQCKTLLTPLLQQIQRHKAHRSKTATHANSNDDNNEDCAELTSIETLYAAVEAAESEMVQQHGMERIQQSLTSLQQQQMDTNNNNNHDMHDHDDDNNDDDDDNMQANETVAAIAAAIQQHQRQQHNQPPPASVFMLPHSNSNSNNNKNNNKYNQNSSNSQKGSKPVASSAAMHGEEEEEDTWSTDDEDNAMDAS